MHILRELLGWIQSYKEQISAYEHFPRGGLINWFMGSLWVTADKQAKRTNLKKGIDGKWGLSLILGLSKKKQVDG